MDFLKNLKKKTLLVVPNSMKSTILEKIQKLDFLPNIKILCFSELLQKFDFNYTKEACIYLTQKYHFSVDIAEVYIQNMYFLDEDCVVSPKLKKILEIKKDLFEQKLFYKDHLFIDIIKNWDVIIYGYDYFLKEEQKFIDHLKSLTCVRIYPKESVPSKQCIVHQFQTIEEELEYVFESICELLDHGVSCNQMKFADLPTEYHEDLIRFAKFYHLPISLSNKISLYQTQIGKKTIQYLKKGYSFIEIKDLLSEEFEEQEIITQIIDIFNQYLFLSVIDEQTISWIIKDMKNTYIKESKKKEAIECISFKNYCYNPEHYIFVLGFNNKNFPKIYKDEGFISDFEKKKMGFTTTEEKNKLEKETLIRHLFEIKHLVITYKLTTFFDRYYPSTLIQDLQMEVVKDHSDFEIHHSKIYDSIKLTSMLDEYIQLGKKHPLLDKYKSNIVIPYRTYKHEFQGIDSTELKSFLNSKLTLSYSSLDRFFHCPFRYFLQDILKISKYEETLSTMIGNIYHAVLARCFEEDFDFEKVYQEEIEKYETTPKEQFYLEKLKSNLDFVIQTIRAQNLITGFNQALYEEKILVRQNYDFPVNFVGFIDKILWKDSKQEKLVSIIDYKTGSPNLDLRLVPLGLNLQLPVYMYLLSNSTLFKDCQIVGIYLQKILQSPPINEKNLETSKKDSLKLCGYSLDCEEQLQQWDPTYENSEIVKGLKKTKNGGWYAHSKVLSTKEMDTLIQIVKDKLQEAIQKILQADFSIQPKRVSGKNIGCEFCKFYDICYRKEQDIIDVQAEEDLSFLAVED